MGIWYESVEKVLRTLILNGPMSQTNLMKITNISNNKTFYRMEKLGLIENERNGKYKKVKLSNHGKNIAKAMNLVMDGTS